MSAAALLQSLTHDPTALDRDVKQKSVSSRDKALLA